MAPAGFWRKTSSRTSACLAWHSAVPFFCLKPALDKLVARWNAVSRSTMRFFNADAAMMAKVDLPAPRTPTMTMDASDVKEGISPRTGRSGGVGVLEALFGPCDGVKPCRDAGLESLDTPGETPSWAIMAARDLLTPAMMPRSMPQRSCSSVRIGVAKRVRAYGVEGRRVVVEPRDRGSNFQVSERPQGSATVAATAPSGETTMGRS